jgi:hypothetical protein
MNDRENSARPYERLELRRPSHTASGGGNTLRSGCDFSSASADSPEMLEFKLRLCSALPYSVDGEDRLRSLQFGAQTTFPSLPGEALINWNN